MGIDPGSIRFGVGLLEKKNNRISYVYSLEIKLTDADFNTRMKTLWRQLGDLYQRFPVDDAAIEEGFLGKNVKSMNLLSKVRGVVLASLIHREIGLQSYSPAQVKQALTGSGAADKAQVARMVQTLLNIKERKLGNDESDALAVAYCHLLSTGKRRTVRA